MKKTLIEDHRRAGFPFLAVQATGTEERRFLLETLPALESAPNIYWLDATGIVSNARTGEQEPTSPPTPQPGQPPKTPSALLIDRLATDPAEQRSVAFIADCRGQIASPGFIREILNQWQAVKQNRATVVFIGAQWSLPPELQDDLPILRYGLPDRESISAALDIVKQGAQLEALEPDTETRLIAGGLGLNQEQAENSFALAAVAGRDTGSIHAETVEAEKARLIAGLGFLNQEKPLARNRIGGLSALIDWTENEVLSAHPDKRTQIRAIGMVGQPGCGKSLFSKVLATLADRPLLRADLSACKTSLQGGSQENLRKLFATVDAYGPCVLWFDEVEKSLAGHTSGGSLDAGTSLEMVGQLLQWLDVQENALITATCNDYSLLPSPLVSRFDQFFLVDLPTEEERAAIARIHLERFAAADLEPADLEEFAATVAKLAREYSGREIEKLIKSAARRTAGNYTVDALTDAVSRIYPVSLTNKAEIDGLREFARNRFPRANSPEAPQERTQARLID